ncbi:MAG: kinase [Thermoplasmata archaeon]
MVDKNYSNGNTRIVITKTPLRITFTGGGTDLPDYYKKYGTGAVVSATINKYIYVTIAKNFYNDEIRVSYSKTENALKNVEDIQHPTVREAMKLLGIRSGIQIISITEVPSSGTGLGSSSSFLVGLLNALHGWLGEAATPRQLAEEAIKVEREILKEPGGMQDQYMAAYGGIQFMEFFQDGNVSLKQAMLKREDRNALKEHLLLFYTGRERSSANIHREQAGSIDSYVEQYRKMSELAYETYNKLSNGNWKELGELLDLNWNLKKQLSNKISDDCIDKWYEKAKKAGAIGGKLIGAGGGGFMLFFADPSKHDGIRKALPELREESFNFEPFGSRILYIENT